MNAYGHYFDTETKEIHAFNRESNSCEDNGGVGYMLFHSMKDSAAKGLNAQIDAVTGHVDSFKAFFKRCVRLAISMRNRGIERGDIISICSYNHLNSAVPYMAAHFIGAIIAPTDPSVSIDDQRYLLNLVRPKMVFVCNGKEELISKALASLAFHCEIVTFARDKGRKYVALASLIEKQENEASFEPVFTADPTATCVILFSSGTTGLPKGICLNHKYIMSTFSGVNMFKKSNPRVLLYSSLYWISAIIFQTLCFHCGLERVVCTHYEPKLLWEYVVKYQIHFVFLAPVQAIKSIPSLTIFKGDKIPLNMLLMAGSTIATTYYKRLRELLPETLIVNGYGQTEIGLISMFQEPDDSYLNKLGSSGYLAINAIAKIVDIETDKSLDLNQIGEIRIKTPNPMNGYYNQESSSAWDSDGFIKTGDLGYFDDELCLYVTDRIKEMFKYQSWHIVPAKLEAILQSHPKVELAVVVGIPHPIDDNHALGVVTLSSDETVSPNELEEFMEERVDDRHRLRAGVIILKKMPLTPTGKIMRREVKQMIEKRVQLSL